MQGKSVVQKKCIDFWPSEEFSLDLNPCPADYFKYIPRIHNSN